VPVDGPNTDFATLVAPGTEPKIHSIFDFTAEALEQLAFWIEQRGLHIPVTQLIGFSQFTAQAAPFISSSESTTSTAYTALATAGPAITGLSDGRYLVMYGALISTSSGGDRSIMSLSYNGAAASDSDACESRDTNLSSVSRTTTATLAGGGNNSITAKYRSSVGTSTATFASRWLVALRYGN
jgi:hypothetical protein